VIGENSLGAGDPGPLVVLAGEVTLRGGGAISGVPAPAATAPTSWSRPAGS
jgi:hypothetical protein